MAFVPLLILASTGYSFVSFLRDDGERQIKKSRRRRSKWHFLFCFCSL